MPASTSLMCTASLDSLDGRKAWVSAQVLDRPGGTLYATAKALFVIPKVSTVQLLRCCKHQALRCKTQRAFFISSHLSAAPLLEKLICMVQDKMLPPSKHSESAAFSAQQPSDSGPETETEIERLDIQT